MENGLTLNIGGFGYADIYQAGRLPVLDRRFQEFVAERDSALAQRFAAYRAGAALDAVATSELLIAVARHLEDFLVRLFGVDTAREQLRQAQREETPVAAFKEQFVKRHARRRRAGAIEFGAVHARLCTQLGDGPINDMELTIARLWARAQENQETQTLALLEDWVWAACNTPEGKRATRGWTSIKLPGKLDYFKLVPVEPVPDDPYGRVQGLAAHHRRRDGFTLTDARAGLREVMDQVHYCVYCHQHAGDFCSRGFPDKESGDYRVNPLGVTLTGCPLGEKISEAHVLKLEGFGLGALAMIMLDNPLVPATGHRICNDCMKACVYQKQEPVNIPQIETRILTDVLDWPWGFEIYYLLTRWNPLNRARPHALPDQGRRVLCVGAGPAGFNLAQHLLQEGIAVVMIDGLRIEPLPNALTGANGQVPQPIERIESLRDSLDERAMSGFGGVAEYGITVRWDKNFLKLVHLTLARNALYRVYGGVRLGGTLTIEDAWELGFDHVALATGAGKPTVISIQNNLAHGLRQANDFLMALQLTGAAKKTSLANLQVRLPAVVIGGGLTAVDTATEVQAYYIRQVEKLLARHETLAAMNVHPTLSPAEEEILAEYLDHGRQVRAERARAAAGGGAPDFTPLIRRWGGVTVAYRRAMNESPAYLRNHEEIEKALQEGIYYLEALDPVEAVLDDHGHVQAMLFRRQVKREDGNRADADGDALLRLPARMVLVAAGSSPNTVYEREHPGTFAMAGRYYATHATNPDDPAPLERVDGNGHCKSERVGFFSSYENAGRVVSVLGDNHPQFHGSVVKAMASGKRAAGEIAELLSRQPRSGASVDWPAFAADLDRRLRPRIAAVERLAPHLVRVTIRAPQATRNWKPGQVYRLQNFESRARHIDGTLLQMEGMAVDGVHVDKERGEVKLLLNEVGASSRIAACLPVDEPVVLMGPTGTGLPVPHNQTIAVIGNHSAVTSAIDGAAVWRAAGNRILFIGHFASREKAQPVQALMEILSDQAIWVLDQGPVLECQRPRDACFVHGMDDFLSTCQRADAPYAEWLRASDQLLISDRPQAMEAVAYALRTYLHRFAKNGLRATVAVNSPMQCMMKEVCAQCLCRHRDPVSGATTRVVFSCFNQHQPLLEVDFANLRARQGQNSLQEKISNLWLTHLLGTTNASQACLTYSNNFSLGNDARDLA